MDLIIKSDEPFKELKNRFISTTKRVPAVIDEIENEYLKNEYAIEMECGLDDLESDDEFSDFKLTCRCLITLENHNETYLMEQYQDHMRLAINYLKNKFPEHHDNYTEKHLVCRDDLKAKLLDEHIQKLIRLSETRHSLEYYQLAVEVYSRINELRISKWSEWLHSRILQFEVLAYLRDKFSDQYETDSLDKRDDKTLDQRILNLLNKSGKTICSLEYYDLAIEVYSEISKFSINETDSYWLKDWIACFSMMAYLKKKFMKLYDQHPDDLMIKIEELDYQLIGHHVDKLLQLSNKKPQQYTYEFCQMAIEVYTEIDKFDYRPLSVNFVFWPVKIKNYRFEIMKLSMFNASSPEPVFMMYLDAYVESLLYGSEEVYYSLYNDAAQNFHNNLVLYFIRMPRIDATFNNISLELFVLQEYWMLNDPMLKRISKLLNIIDETCSATVRQGHLEQLKSILTSDDFACIDYYEMNPKNSYYQYIFVNKKHLQIRIKSYDDGEGSSSIEELTVGFYRYNPINWFGPNGPMLQSTHHVEQDFVTLRRDNEDVKYVCGLLIPTRLPCNNHQMNHSCFIWSNTRNVESVMGPAHRKSPFNVDDMVKSSVTRFTIFNPTGSRPKITRRYNGSETKIDYERVNGKLIELKPQQRP